MRAPLRIHGAWQDTAWQSVPEETKGLVWRCHIELYHSGATCNHLIPAPFLPDSLRFCLSPVPQGHPRSELSFSSASRPLAVQVWVPILLLVPSYSLPIAQAVPLA